MRGKEWEMRRGAQSAEMGKILAAMREGTPVKKLLRIAAMKAGRVRKRELPG